MIPIITKQWTYPTNTQLQGKGGMATFAGVKTIRDTLQDHIEKVSTQFTAYNLVDTLANRPAPGMMGRKFFATDTNTLYIDNGTSWVPSGGSFPFTINIITTNTTIDTSSSLIIADTTAGSLVITLPTATGSGFAPTIKKIGSMNNLTLQPTPATDTFDGVSFATGYLVFSTWRAIQVVDYAAGKWAILGG